MDTSYINTLVIQCQVKRWNKFWFKKCLQFCKFVNNNHKNGLVCMGIFSWISICNISGVNFVKIKVEKQKPHKQEADAK